MQNRQRTLSPYTGLPLRRAVELSYDSIEKINRFMTGFSQYDNRAFPIKRAAFCRETSRVFSYAITWFGEISIGWDFLQKRYPGHWVSWGSLSLIQQEAIREVHQSLEGFQTEFSSSAAAPRFIEDQYAYIKPGPLYVDIETKIVLGWKKVPGTDLEVLIVQKPKAISHD